MHTQTSAKSLYLLASSLAFEPGHRVAAHELVEIILQNND